MAINKLEIEEIIGELVDFSLWTDEDWERADAEITAECERRGIDPAESMEMFDKYAAICDGVCSRIASAA